MKKLIIVMMLLVSSVCYASTNYDIIGIWKGYFKANGEYTKVTEEFEQYEDGTIVGTWKTSGGGRGSVGGKLKGRTFTFTMKNKTKGCSGSYSGKGRLSIDGTQIKYSLSGSDCTGEISGGGKVYYKE